MKNIEIIGYKRANLGKRESKSVRQEGSVPCVLYGAGEQVHFHSPMILFRELVYTNEAHFVTLNIEGEIHRAILQDVQFHPVSEIILHADFLRISDERKVKMSIPVRLKGQALGVKKGGTLIQKKNHIKAYGYPKDMPEYIDVDVESLDFHHAIKISDMPKGKLEYLDAQRTPVAVVEVPRAAKLAAEEKATAAAQPQAATAEAEKPKEEAKK